MTICFKPPPKVIRQPTISREILKDPELDLVVRLSVADTYALHSDTLIPEERDHLCNRIGRSKKTHRDAGLQESFFCEGSRSELEKNTRAGKIAEILECLDSIPWEGFFNGPLLNNTTVPPTSE